MPAFFKRFEVWLLLALVLAGIGFVIFSGGERDRDAPGGGREKHDLSPAGFAAAADPGLTLENVIVTREGENLIAEVRVRVKNPTDQDQELTGDNARLLTREGVEVPPFFAAFATPSVIPAGQENSAVLRYWLDASLTNRELWLETLGRRALIKNEGKIDVGAVPENSPQTFETPDWKL